MKLNSSDTVARVRQYRAVSLQARMAGTSPAITPNVGNPL